MADGILIVDGNRGNTARMSDILGTVGYKVTVAKDGNEARQYLNPTQHGIIFVASYLPDEGGVDLIRDLKPIAPKSKVVILAESHDALLAHEAASIGVKNWLFQPATPPEILRSASEALVPKIK